MSLLPSGAIETGGYDINNSLRFRSSASAFLNRTPTVAGNRRTWTWSAWAKTSLDCSFMYAKNGNYGTKIYFNDNKFGVFDWQANVAIYWEVASSAVFRDPAAWYHLVVAVDTTQATAANRVKLYVNGNQITSLATSNYPTQNYDCIMNTVNPTFIGKQSTTVYGEQSFFDGYMTEVNFIDGQALTPSSFGETDAVTGVWKAKKYTGTYGTNGFYLKFSDIATTSGSNAGLGKDFSGNGNYWTTNNISVTAGTTYDAMTDSPTLTSATVANYCVLNPLDIIPSRTLPVISGGNLDASNGGSGDDLAHGTIAVSSGKWYFEMIAGTVPGATTHFVGWQVPVPSPVNGGLYRNNGLIYDFSAATTSAPTYTANDIIGCVVDVDAGKVWFSKNGTYVNSGNPAAGTNPAYTFTAGTLITPALAFDNIASTCTASVNFGQRPFAYTPPTGFNRLNTYNLPDSTIKKGNSYMNVLTYTGNSATSSAGTVARTLTGLGFQPDLTWVKSRNNGGSWDNHSFTDSVRGNNLSLSSNATDAEINVTTAFGSGGVGGGSSDGFTIVSGTSGTTTNLNASSGTYVGWCWKANGAGSSNTSGSITSTVSVNTTAGFSIVTFTGTGSIATVGHGLGVAPKMVIVKSRSAGSTDWVVYHASLGATKNVRLQSTAVAATQTVMWNDTAPTSTVFTIGTNNNVNTNGQTQVAYCWAEIAGFSRFGSYVGNGAASGPFIYTGFRPKFVMIKNVDTIVVPDFGSWKIIDTSRDTFNGGNPKSLYANRSYQEGLRGNGSSDAYVEQCDLLSNGFKLGDVTSGSYDVETNQSGVTYIYVAFAENPFKNALAR